MEPKRLYRSMTDRKFAGVAGGLAEYFVMDSMLIRLAFVILTLAGGGGVLIYLIFWIVTPENPVRVSPTMNQPGQNSQQTTYDSPGNTAEPLKSETTSSSSPLHPQTKERKGSLIGGLVLITLGALFLADELIPQINFGDLWPVILIVIGVGLLINAVTKRNRSTNQY
jgi:phage shock protein PspC (stress-responsive transcriptional regulator)